MSVIHGQGIDRWARKLHITLTGRNVSAIPVVKIFAFMDIFVSTQSEHITMKILRLNQMNNRRFEHGRYENK